VTRLEGVSVCIAACAVYRMQSSLICSRRRAQVDDSTGSRRSTLEAPRRFAGQQRPDARGRIEGATGMPRGRRQTHLSRLPQNLAQHEVAKEAPFFPSVPEVEQETWLDEAVETAKKYCAYIQPHSHFDQKREREREKTEENRLLTVLPGMYCRLSLTLRLASLQFWYTTSSCVVVICQHF
jgi:hypothetical protein